MYDAIVIGARCAGSPTAMLLARKGYKVLLVDRANFPSDSMRNHFIRHPGVKQLHRWNLLERVKATNCPPVRTYTTDFGDSPMTGTAPTVGGADAEYGPRRYVLDKLLLDAAAEAGADVREGFSVQELLSADDLITGVRGKSKGGQLTSDTARIVIGADGQHSFVARTVGAPMYDMRPPLTCGYFSYWSGLDCKGQELYMSGGGMILTFSTNDGLTCIAVQRPISEFPEFRLDVEGYFMRMLQAAPDLAERVRLAKREERFYGTADLPNFFRKPYGPGWALVGDAGYHKDPITARGISDAFRDAELLSDAVDAALAGGVSFDTALAEYEQKRNEAALPTYEEACQVATFAPMPQGWYQLRARLRGNQALIDMFVGMGLGTVTRDDFNAALMGGNGARAAS